jgi:hypothetical protein
MTLHYATEMISPSICLLWHACLMYYRYTGHFLQHKWRSNPFPYPYIKEIPEEQTGSIVKPTEQRYNSDQYRHKIRPGYDVSRCANSDKSRYTMDISPRWFSGLERLELRSSPFPEWSFSQFCQRSGNLFGATSPSHTGLQAYGVVGAPQL